MRSDHTAPLVTKPQWSALLHQGRHACDLMQKEPVFLIKVGPKKGLGSGRTLL